MLPGGPGPSELALPGLLVAPWDMIFAIPKNLSKNRPVRHIPFGAHFRQFHQNNEKNVEMRVILGPSCTHFLRFFDGCSFSWNFSHFSMKNLKNEKVSPDT